MSVHPVIYTEDYVFVLDSKVTKTKSGEELQTIIGHFPLNDSPHLPDLPVTQSADGKDYPWFVVTQGPSDLFPDRSKKYLHGHYLDSIYRGGTGGTIIGSCHSIMGGISNTATSSSVATTYGMAAGLVTPTSKT
jgi:hypothetical protein